MGHGTNSATPVSVRSRSPPRSWRPSAASSRPAPTPRTWSSPAPAGAWWPGAPGRCYRATTSGAPTTAPSPSWLTQRPCCAQPPPGCSRRSARLAPRRPTSSWSRSPTRAEPCDPPPSRPPSVSLPRVAWRLRMGEGRLGAGHHWSLPAIRSWTRSISAAPMTSGTPLRPGWRTPASQPE